MDLVDLHGSMTAGQLAAESGLSTVLDRMEGAGYLRRVRDTEERRRVVVELTDLTRSRAGEIWGPIAAEAESFYAGYSTEQLEQLLDFLELAREFLARHRTRIEAMGAAPAATER